MKKSASSKQTESYSLLTEAKMEELIESLDNKVCQLFLMENNSNFKISDFMSPLFNKKNNEQVIHLRISTYHESKKSLTVCGVRGFSYYMQVLSRDKKTVTHFLKTGDDKNIVVITQDLPEKKELPTDQKPAVSNKTVKNEPFLDLRASC